MVALIKKSVLIVSYSFIGLILISACNPEPDMGISKQVEINNGPECSSVEACIHILSSYELDPDAFDANFGRSGVSLNKIGNATRALREHGPIALDELIQLLRHPHHQVRTRAGYAISQISPIAADYGPALIAAHRDGVSWLEMPIGRTGTEEALAYLWFEFLYDPRENTNLQSMMGLAQFGDRTFERIELVISRCAFEVEATVCIGLVELSEFFPSFPKSALSLFEILATHPSLDEYQQQKALLAAARLRKQPH